MTGSGRRSRSVPAFATPHRFLRACAARTLLADWHWHSRQARRTAGCRRSGACRACPGPASPGHWHSARRRRNCSAGLRSRAPNAVWRRVRWRGAAPPGHPGKAPATRPEASALRRIDSPPLPPRPARCGCRGRAAQGWRRSLPRLRRGAASRGHWRSDRPPSGQWDWPEQPPKAGLCAPRLPTVDCRRNEPEPP